MGDGSANGLALRTMDDVERIARIAVASGYTACRKMEEAAMLVITGQELGLSPAQSLRGIYVVSGKPVLSADLMVAVVRRSGLCESWRVVESTAERCTITTRRKGESHESTRTWTLADAKRAGVTGKGVWSAFPAAMLRHRCAADLARQEYPDVLMGLYDPEELGGEYLGLPAVVAQETPALPASSTPPALARFRVDLGAAESLIDARDTYRAYRVELTDADATTAVTDVRAWIAGRGIMLDGAGVTAVLSTLPDAALRCLDASRDDLLDAARVCRAAGWDEHSTMTVWSALARAYAAQTGAKSAKVAAAALKTACQDHDPDDGPRGGSKPAPQTTPADAHGSAQDGAQGAASEARAQHPEAWRETAAGIRAHVAGISNIPRLANSARKHLRAIAPALRDHAVAVYAGRFAALAPDVSDDEAHQRAQAWLIEGPKVADLPARPKRPTLRAAGGAG